MKFLLWLITFLTVFKIIQIYLVFKESNGKCLVHDYTRFDPTYTKVKLYETFTKFKLTPGKGHWDIYLEMNGLMTDLFETHEICKNCNHKKAESINS